MKNYYFTEKMSKNFQKQLNLEPLTLNLTENELIDSDVNQVDLARFDDAFNTVHNNEFVGIINQTASNGETRDEDQSVKQKAYVDFELFYSSLTKAKAAGLIDSTNFKKLNEKANDN